MSQILCVGTEDLLWLPKGLWPVSLSSLSSFYSFIWTNKAWLGATMTCSVLCVYTDTHNHYSTQRRTYSVCVCEVSRKPVTNKKPVPMCLHSFSLPLQLYFGTDSLYVRYTHTTSTVFSPRFKVKLNVTLFF
jgi:hypothetical protein